MTVRFTRKHPCPVCGGHAQLPQGQGVRCWGNLDATGSYARCTREDRAGDLRQNDDGTFSHLLTAPCRCGKEHGTGPRPDLSRPVNGGSERETARETRYPIHDANAVLVAYHVRYDRSDGSKAFVWLHPDGRRSHNGEIKPASLLYGLELLAERAGKSVVLVEGERCADAARKSGVLAVATVCGAQSTPTREVLSHLSGRRVLTWPDNDPEGHRHMNACARTLSELGCEVRAVDWPDAPAKGDVADYLNIHSREQLGELLRAAQPWEPKPMPAEEPPEPTDQGEAPTVAPDWRPIDLGPYIRGEKPTTVPTCLERADGHFLLYPGKLHLISGEPEGMKSWLALTATVERLKAGENVVYIDHEKYPDDMAERLGAMGISEQTAREHLMYLRPQSRPTTDSQNALIALAMRVKPTLLVHDGIGMAMAASGLNPHSEEFLPWLQANVKPLQAVTPGPTLLSDHVVKDPEKRGDYAAGSYQKQAQVDVHIGVLCTAKFGRGRTGKALLKLHKDFPGWLRSIEVSNSMLGTLTMHSDPLSGAVTHELRAPDGESGPKAFRPTELMEKISRFMEARPDLNPSKNAIEEGVPGKRDTKRLALQVLIDERHVAVKSGPRNAQEHVLIRPYRAAEDNEPRTSPPPRPDLAPREVQHDLAPRPHPYRGGEVRSLQGRASEETTSPLMHDLPEAIE